ncbi:DNA cytosine methyltransferase [Rhodoferax koreense]|uniref:DNA cytosine methyltransferase n=1 Tax=Rhodoferax koreensis TaxID=1842727 RepID=A0A1P8JXL7_9BURK|nr:DNA cytosine methyltransferase [Rhodoferax koreense]APW38488.1 DNA cytosine methyltransferase [Rhodoferax koreense]
MIEQVEIRHGHLFCGLGGGAKGFNRARPCVGNKRAKFRCIGGIDVDPASIRDFGKLTGVAGTVLDMFDREQYVAFHDRQPPADWREATTADIHRAFGGERPHIVFLSAPCKGFSGLLSETKSLTGKYQALNRLTLRGVWLLLEAFKDDPVELLLFENVPRIATRGRHLLDQIVDLLRAYGYAVAETTHDCGEIGGLAQSRKRFLLVARHMEKVPPFLYEPEKRNLRAVGDVLGRMLLPGDLRAGPMHRVPSLQWKTWVRLAFVEAGSDWRSLNKLAVENGHLRDYLVVPEFHHGYLGVQRWDGTSGTVAGRSSPSNGAFSIADPRQQLYAAGYGVNRWEDTAGAVSGESLPSNGRFAVADVRFSQSAKWSDGQAYGVHAWGDSTGAIAGQQNPGQGAYAVADPRHGGPAKHSNEYRIVPWSGSAMAVTSAHGTGQAVADPRGGEDPAKLHGRYHVTPWEKDARAVIAGSTSGEGAFAVADPRSGIQRDKGDAYLTAGHYGVVPWEEAAGAVSAAAGHDNGRWNVADPRTPDFAPTSEVQKQIMPAPAQKLICRIQSLDGTWHRPFTTLELAALQSLVDPEDQLELDGLSDQAWRERIGNAVPSDAAQAIGEVMGTTLLLAWSGETFMLSSQPIWVRNVAVGLSVRGAV